MAARVFDFRRQLTGRSLVEIPGRTYATGPNRLWQYVGEGSYQKSLIVYNDGTVVETTEVDYGDILYDSNVHTFIRGGTDFRCEPDGWLHDTLIAAGYDCQYAVEDIYTEDYTTEYPRTEDGS